MQQKLRTLVDFSVKLLSSGFYSGYVPFMPGTSGTAVGVGVYVLFMPRGLYGYLAVTMACIVAGIWITGEAELIYAKKDDQRIVLDEVAGYLVSMFMLPRTPEVITAGFVVFRFFDWVKPFPIKKLEEMGGGAGIMADDVMAGVYTCLCLHTGLHILRISAS
ncbi:MAG: phosphatidylglycerophosphatase A [bacterium]